MIADTGQVLNPAATDENNGVFLQVMADAGDIRGNLDSIS
jgi:hypothetical protein